MYVSEMFDQLRLLLVDPSDTDYPFETKKLYLNRGIDAMFPKVYMIETDETTALVEDDVEYIVPTAFAGGYITSVEIEDPDTGYYSRLDTYDLTHNRSGDTLIKLDFQPTADQAGMNLRFRGAIQIPRISAASYAAAGSETWLGPAQAIEIPVAYAMSLCYITALNPRMDFGEYSVQNQNGAADIVSIMGAGQYWMEQFRMLLDQHEMPLPISVV